jgi:hypothetical protein
MDSTKPYSRGGKPFRTMLPLSRVIALTGVLTLACGAHLVAASPVTDPSSHMPSGAKRDAPKTMSLQVIDGRQRSDTKYVKIFDNLAAPPSGTYWGEVELIILGGGGNSTFPDDQIAAAFTPSANHTATKIEVAVVQSSLGYGTAGFTLSLNQDAGGVPGKALLTAQLPGLPNNGSGWCCALIVGSIPSGIALSGGTQYWVVVNGQGSQTSDAAAWDMNATDQLHPFLDAVYCSYTSKCPNGNGWYPFSGTIYGTGAAFAVLGSS